MQELKGFQKKFLRGLAHGLSPVVIIGQNGFTDAVARAVDNALKDHELIKIKFNEFKEKQQKRDIIGKIESKANCRQAGAIGHTAIFFRENENPEDRIIDLPDR